MLEFNKFRRHDKYLAYRYVVDVIHQIKSLKNIFHAEYLDKTLIRLKTLRNDTFKLIDMNKEKKFVKSEIKDLRYQIKQDRKFTKMYVEQKQSLRQQLKNTIGKTEKDKIRNDIKYCTDKINEFRQKGKEMRNEINQRLKEVEYLVVIPYSCKAWFFREIDEEEYNSLQKTREKGAKGITTKGSILKRDDNRYYKIMLKEVNILVDTSKYDNFGTITKNQKRFYRDRDTEKFSEIVEIFRTNDNFRDKVWTEEVANYCSLIILYDVNPILKMTKIRYIAHKEPLQDVLSQKYVMFRYIDYGLNKNASKFEELFLYETQHTESHFRRCFLDLIVDTYSNEINSKLPSKDVIKTDRFVFIHHLIF